MSAILCLLLIFMLAGYLNAQEMLEASDDCIGCICEGSSKCNKDRKCYQGFCGAFLIDEEYWKDAGSPTVDGDLEDVEAWKKCALDIYCASNVVREYMKKYRKDCNGDGVIDCRDFAMLHRLGTQCKGVFKGSFKNNFNTCYQLLFP